MSSPPVLLRVLTALGGMAAQERPRGTCPLWITRPQKVWAIEDKLRLRLLVTPVVPRPALVLMWIAMDVTSIPILNTTMQDNSTHSHVSS